MLIGTRLIPDATDCKKKIEDEDADDDGEDRQKPEAPAGFCYYYLG